MRYWLLDLHVVGEVRRRTDAPDALVVTTAAGGELLYEPGLAELVASRPGLEVSIGLTIEDAATWHTYGPALEESPVELRRWWTGAPWEQAELIAVGVARDVEWGEPGEGVALTLAADAADSDPLLSPQARIDDATWPSGEVLTAPYVPEASAGAPYVLPIGYPGHAPTLGGPFSIVPAVFCDVTNATPISDVANRLLLAEGRIDAGAVSVGDSERGTYVASTLSTATTRDLLGRLVTYTDFTDDGTLKPTSPLGEQRFAFWVGYQNDATYGGGLLDPYGTGVLRGAGSVIRWVLRRTCSHLRIDWEDVERSVPWFDGYNVDTYFNDPEMRGMEWLESVVLPMVPHRWVTTARGLSIRPWRWRATRADAVAHLVAGVDVERASSVRTYAAGDRWTEVTVRYRPMRSGANWRSSRTLTAQPGRLTRTPGAAEDSRILSSPIALAAQRRRVVPVTRDLPAVWDDATALRIAEDMLLRHALVHEAITYQAQSDAWERLQVGDVVLLTDDAIDHAERIALVDDVPVGADLGPALALVLTAPLTR